MNRRDFIRSTAAGAVAIATGGAVVQAVAKAVETMPTIPAMARGGVAIHYNGIFVGYAQDLVIDFNPHRTRGALRRRDADKIGADLDTEHVNKSITAPPGGNLHGLSFPL